MPSNRMALQDCTYTRCWQTRCPHSQPLFPSHFTFLLYPQLNCIPHSVCSPVQEFSSRLAKNCTKNLVHAQVQFKIPPIVWVGMRNFFTANWKTPCTVQNQVCTCSVSWHKQDPVFTRQGGLALCTLPLPIPSFSFLPSVTNDTVKVEIWDVVDKGRVQKTKGSKGILKMFNSPDVAEEEEGQTLDASFLDVYKGAHGVVFTFDITKQW